jgi:hypothetical protein
MEGSVKSGIENGNVYKKLIMNKEKRNFTFKTRIHPLVFVPVFNCAFM